MSSIRSVPAVVCALICFAGFVYWDLIQLQVFSVLASNHGLHLVIDHGGLSDCSRCQHLPCHGLHSEGALGRRCTRPPRRPGRVVEMALFSLSRDDCSVCWNLNFASSMVLLSIQIREYKLDVTAKVKLVDSEKVSTIQPEDISSLGSNVI